MSEWNEQYLRRSTRKWSVTPNIVLMIEFVNERSNIINDQQTIVRKSHCVIEWFFQYTWLVRILSETFCTSYLCGVKVFCHFSKREKGLSSNDHYILCIFWKFTTTPSPQEDMEWWIRKYFIVLRCWWKKNSIFRRYFSDCLFGVHYCIPKNGNVTKWNKRWSWGTW